MDCWDVYDTSITELGEFLHRSMVRWMVCLFIRELGDGCSLDVRYWRQIGRYGIVA